jgi:hypothetical protein
VRSFAEASGRRHIGGEPNPCRPRLVPAGRIPADVLPGVEGASVRHCPLVKRSFRLYGDGVAVIGRVGVGAGHGYCLILECKKC